MSKLKPKDLTFIDLFAGCGGLSLGLEQAGFFPLYVNELNKDALETYLINRDKHYPHLRNKFYRRQLWTEGFRIWEEYEEIKEEFQK